MGIQQTRNKLSAHLFLQWVHSLQTDTANPGELSLLNKKETPSKKKDLYLLGYTWRKHKTVDALKYSQIRGHMDKRS